MGLGLAIALALAGCATPSGPRPSPGFGPVAAAPAPGDPFERLNRRMFALGQAFDRTFVRPIIAGFQNHTPGPVRKAVHNVLQNADEPVVFVNDVLQGRLAPAVRTAARFVGNTTVGLAGLFDPAAKAGLAHHDNDFGVTLGRYGVGGGPYLYVPVAGPTNLRDAVGAGVDYVVDPLSWLRFRDAKTVGATRTALNLVDQRLEVDADLRTLEATAADPYATVRSVYGQARDAEIRGPGNDLEELPDLPPSAAPAADAAAPLPPQATPEAPEAEPPGPRP